MKHWSRPRQVALFQDACLSKASSRSSPDGILLNLALARMEFLRSHEKLLLSAAVDSASDLMSIHSGDLQGIVMRSLSPGVWTPQIYLEKARRDAEFLAKKNIVFVVLGDRRYPPQLGEVYRPPFGLYLRGRLPDPEMPCVALVGTRAATGRGLAAAYRLAHELSSGGVCVVSGLALGIDSAAHRGAIKGKAKTLAVLPGGMDSVYPASNRTLAARILDEGGALVTENPPETRILRYRFPERNRIIAGLARSCVVVEAPEGSGALITAEHALSEGRDVFVHKACLGGSRNLGGDALASQGAVPVEEAADIIAEWTSCGGRSEFFPFVRQGEEIEHHG